MRSPKVVLENLASHSQDKNYVFKRLYRNLYNPEFYFTAYQNIYAKEGNMTKGTDNLTIDGMSEERVQKIIKQIKNLSYRPNPVRRVFIPKRNGKKRPLGIPSVDDKLVQEVVRMLLESIYEPCFSKQSHGFRKKHSCHTALSQIKSTFTGVRWFIEGDIEGFFDNINHQILIKLLCKRIQDGKFIDLIWKFIRAGYIENWKYYRTFSGTPQGGIISPILSNIYLHEFDQYIGKYKEKFDTGKTRKRNAAYTRVLARKNRAKQKLKSLEKDSNANSQQIMQLKIQIQMDEQEMRKYEAKDPMDNDYKRLQYVRYADDFIIGVIGSKNDAIEIKHDIASFLSNELRLTLSDEKTLITNSKKKARFLGYDIAVRRDQNTKIKTNGVKARSYFLLCDLFMPKDLIKKRLIAKRVVKIKNISQEWKPIHRPEFAKLEPLEIVSIYNAEIRGLYQYYRLAVNVCTLNSFKYIMEYSMYKTLGNKYKTSVAKVIKKFKIEGYFGVLYTTKNGKKILRFYNDGFRRNKEVNQSIRIDNMPSEYKYQSTTNLTQRLTREECEWCGKQNTKLEMHHIRKLKDLKGKKDWERIMIARKRKTMALCKQCHLDLHAGRLD
ncbi:group II intron reverse transcriptase/maturase [Bacillus cereus group sp. N6]|uniref:reverse transcriptase domain-containing protein n=1 Tax=Bacillus cereus group sp. N6 TaxID=2794583 RepID=UPI0018F29B7A|nr:group II intron reverse transcriptase/maturase [Bacillus cereus group sp. N6]